MQKHVVELANVNFSSEQKQITSTKGLQLLGAIYIHHSRHTTTLGGRSYHCPHFSDEDTEAERSQGMSRPRELAQRRPRICTGASLGGLRELVRTGRPGMLRSMGSQRVGQDWAAELNRTDSNRSA